MRKGTSKSDPKPVDPTKNRLPGQMSEYMSYHSGLSSIYFDALGETAPPAPAPVSNGIPEDRQDNSK